MELGELVTVVVDMPADHSEQTCPWHEKRQAEAKKLAKADKEEDVPPPGLPRNDGGVLGGNLGGEPEGVQVMVRYSETTPRKKKVTKNGKAVEKEIAEYVEDASAQPYDVVFSAHHVIPGNEALKGHPVLRFVGDKSSLGDYGQTVSSELADGEFIGYDINAAVNGVWLPGPYALSTTGKWTDKKLASPTTLRFKQAYAFAVMDRTGRQFHYRHTKYSVFVIDCLKKVDTRLEGYAPRCQVKPNGEPAKPYKAPHGLVARFNRISNRLRPLLDGRRWSPHIFTDNDTGPAYIAGGAKRRLKAID